MGQLSTADPAHGAEFQKRLKAPKQKRVLFCFLLVCDCGLRLIHRAAAKIEEEEYNGGSLEELTEADLKKWGILKGPGKVPGRT